MATTPNYGWTLPNVGGDTGAWGTILNTLLNAADAAVFAVSTVANAALARTGGVLTGSLYLPASSQIHIAKGSISGAQALDQQAAQYYSLTVGGALTLSFTNVPAGGYAQGVILRITNGGAFVITWPAGTKWVSGVAPTLTVAGIDLVGFITDDNGATWRGVVIAKDVR